MDATVVNELEELLRPLIGVSGDVIAAALVSADGSIPASLLPESYSSQRLGAVAAALLSLSRQSAEELGGGELAQVFIEGTTGYVFLVPAAGNLAILVVVKRGGRVGPVLQEIRGVAIRVSGLLTREADGEKEPGAQG